MRLKFKLICYLYLRHNIPNHKLAAKHVKSLFLGMYLKKRLLAVRISKHFCLDPKPLLGIHSLEHKSGVLVCYESVFFGQD